MFQEVNLQNCHLTGMISSHTLLIIEVCDKANSMQPGYSLIIVIQYVSYTILDICLLFLFSWDAPHAGPWHLCVDLNLLGFELCERRAVRIQITHTPKTRLQRPGNCHTREWWKWAAIWISMYSNYQVFFSIPKFYLLPCCSYSVILHTAIILLVCSCPDDWSVCTSPVSFCSSWI